MAGGVPQPPCCLKVTSACNKTAASCHRHVCRKGKLCGSFVCKWGRWATPNPPAVLKPSMLAIKKEASYHHHVSNEGNLCKSFCLQLGGLHPPNPLTVFEPPMYATAKKYHAVTRFAVREGCAAYFCSCLIFSEYILNQVLTHRTFKDKVILFEYHHSVSTSKQAGNINPALKPLFVPPNLNAHAFPKELVEGVERCKASMCCKLQHVKLSKISRHCHL